MSEDYGSFCECDFDAPVEFYRAAVRTAKKAAKCYECHGPILPGDRYEYASGKCDGEFWTAKTCPTCMALVDWITAHVPCYCRQHGDLFEERLEYLVEDARQTPGFAFGILRRVAAVKKNREQRRSRNEE